MDSDFAGFRLAVGMSRRRVVGAIYGQGKAVAAFHRAAFSSCREVLAVRKEANCC